MLVSSAGCSDSGRGTGSHAVRDSAGIRIVENAAPAWDSSSAWRIDETPALTIGAEDGPEELHLYRVRSAVRLADGRIAVANAGTHQVRVFDASGGPVATLGREGDGPGEFRGLERLWSGRGDSLVAYDAIQRRFTVFAPGGGVAGTYPLPIVEGRPGSTLLVGRFGDGSLLVKAGVPLAPDSPEGVISHPAIFGRAHPGERTANPLRELPDRRSYVLRDGAGSSGFDLPFGSQPQAAVGDDAFFYSSGEMLEIRRFDTAGALRAIFRARADPPRVTEDDKREFRESMLDGVSGPQRARLERYLAGVPFPDRKPPHGRMLVDAEGNLWVLQPQAGDGPFRWWVLAPDGTLFGTVSLPARLRLLEVGTGYVLGVASSPETHVERVALHRIVRPSN